MTQNVKVSEGLHVKEYVVDSDRTWKAKKENIIFLELHSGPIATYAMDLAKHFAMIAGIPDGEDSSGRARVRLSTPQEVVDRACSIAALAFDEFDRRGWLLKSLPPQGIRDESAEPVLLGESDPL